MILKAFLCLTHSVSVNRFANLFAEVSARKSWDKEESAQISKMKNQNPARWLKHWRVGIKHKCQILIGLYHHLILTTPPTVTPGKEVSFWYDGMNENLALCCSRHWPRPRIHQQMAPCCFLRSSYTETWSRWLSIPTFKCWWQIKIDPPGICFATSKSIPGLLNFVVGLLKYVSMYLTTQIPAFLSLVLSFN